MFKRMGLIAILVFCLSFVLSDVCYATQLLTKEEAFKKVFGEGVKITTENKQFTDDKLAKIKERLGGELVYVTKGSKPASVDTSNGVDFYFAEKGGKRTGVAIIDSEPGKWGPVEFIIALDLEGVVTKVEVLSSQEKRGQPVARQSFLSQFSGKTSKNTLEAGKDINSVSGATISSNCAGFSVKKAIVLYEELYLNK